MNQTKTLKRAGQSKVRTLVIGSALLLAAALFAVPRAQAAPGDTVATVTHLSGILTAKHPDGSVKILSIKSAVLEGDVLSTEKEAYARLKFIDASELVLRPNTIMKIGEVAYNEANPKGDKLNLDMVKGGFRAVSGLIGKRNKEAVSYGTPTATIGIRGTHLGALFCSNDCGGVPTPTGKTPDNGLHVDVASGAVVVTPKPTLVLQTYNTTPQPPQTLGGDQSKASGGTGSGTQTPNGGTQSGTQSGTGGTSGTGTGGTTPGGTTPGGSTPNPTAGPTGGISPTLLGGGSSTPTPAPTPAPGSGAPAPSVVLNAGQFGYLPPPQNGVQPPLVLVPPSQAVQVRMPQSISQNNPQGSATSKSTDPECVVQ